MSLYLNIKDFILKIFDQLKTVRPCARELKQQLLAFEGALKSGGKFIYLFSILTPRAAASLWGSAWLDFLELYIYLSMLWRIL